MPITYISSKLYQIMDQNMSLQGIKARPKPLLDRSMFKIGILCALGKEANAVRSSFDHIFSYQREWPRTNSGDSNTYTFGTIGDHHVVLATIGGDGNVQAADAAKEMERSFQNIRLCLLVGICGIIPKIHSEDTALGDIVVSREIVYYTKGKHYPTGHRTRQMLVEASKAMVRGFEQLCSPWHRKVFCEEVHQKLAELAEDDLIKQLKYEYPGRQSDKLYHANYLHIHHDGNCMDCGSQRYCESAILSTCEDLGCSQDHLVQRNHISRTPSTLGKISTDTEVSKTGDFSGRSTLDSTYLPRIYVGRIASGDVVLKNGIARDEYAVEHDVIAFEMEGAGVSSIFPTIVIKAGCDYADSHKNKSWQEWAVITAAACAKAFIEQIQMGIAANVEYYSQDSIETPSRTQRTLASNQSAGRALFMEKGTKNSTEENGLHGIVAEFQQVSLAPPVKKRYFQMPFVPNRRFIGREEKLRELERRMLIEKEVDRMAIVGLGGVGKTQLARAFCYIVKERYTDFSIFWVSAISSATFKQDYTNIARQCSVASGVGEEDILCAVRDHLSSANAGNWLMVVDNADDTKSFRHDERGIANYLPQSETGLILFTTRYKDLADIADYNLLDLEEMSPTEAELLLEKLLRHNDSTNDKAIVGELLQELAYLPLAIVQASSYIIKTSITISKYLTLMKATEKDLIYLLSQDFHDTTRGKGSPNAVAMTWLVSFDHITRDDPEAANILFFLAFLENKAIPFSILPPMQSSSELAGAIGTLIGYSFLSAQVDNEMYDMHRLVHRATKIWMQKQGILEQWREKTVSHLANIYPSDKWENRQLWQSYAPHAIRVLQGIDQVVTEKQANLCLRLGACLYEDGRASESVHWIAKCVRYKDQLSENNASRLSAQHHLAYAYLQNGQIKDAVSMLEKVVAIRSRVLVEDHPNRLASQHELARAYASNGQIREAVSMLEKVVAIRSTLAEDYPDRLASQYELAVAYLSDRRTKEAVSMLEKVVAIHARVLAKDHPDRLTSQHALAVAYRSNGQIEEAISMLEKVVAIRSMLAEDHPERLASQHALAGAYRSNGQTKEAISMLEKVVAIKARVLAEDHPSRLVSEHSLAFSYESENRLDEAISLMQHVVAVREKSLRIDHPDRIGSETELSRMLDQHRRQS